MGMASVRKVIPIFFYQKSNLYKRSDSCYIV